jgi:hypothetical protein
VANAEGIITATFKEKENTNEKIVNGLGGRREAAIRRVRLATVPEQNLTVSLSASSVYNAAPQR